MTVTQTPAHAAGVAVVAERYPFRPVCSCGWAAAWGYVAEHAAQLMADAHEEEPDA